MKRVYLVEHFLNQLISVFQKSIYDELFFDLFCKKVDYPCSTPYESLQIRSEGYMGNQPSLRKRITRMSLVL